MIEVRKASFPLPVVTFARLVLSLSSPFFLFSFPIEIQQNPDSPGHPFLVSDTIPNYPSFFLRGPMYGRSLVSSFSFLFFFPLLCLEDIRPPALFFNSLVVSYWPSFPNLLRKEFPFLPFFPHPFAAIGQVEVFPFFPSFSPFPFFRTYLRGVVMSTSR